MTDERSHARGDFDFWIGHWDVHAGPDDAVVGYNDIESLHSGHVLGERYRTVGGGFTGSSLNGYDTTTGRWHQCWMDSSGLVLDLYGGLVGESMVMRSANQSGVVDQITWTPLADGSVRQHWQQSEQGDDEWTTVFDGSYRHRESGVSTDLTATTPSPTNVGLDETSSPPT